ncbi:PpiC-type peptidyl-prolyl cis-trans isomerase [Candidatus Magnetomorum sp. HK-1]|nr:PpiC-type peptidyl-prolyl cis-trans isomerase [Candidatus Magnetomorum sp. HK-1]
MLWIYRLFILIVFMAMVSPSYGELIDRILAVVNNDIVTLAQFKKTYSKLAMQIRTSDYTQDEQTQLISNLNQKVLDTLIEETLTEQQAEVVQLEIEDKEVEDTINGIKKKHNYTDDEFAQILEMQGSSIKEFQSHIRKQKLQSRLLGIMVQSKVVITDDDVKAYFDSHPEKYQSKTTYHLRTIIKRAVSEIAQENMKTALKQFEKGIPFADLAKQYAEPAFAETGGLLGSYTLDQLSLQIQEAIKDLQKGECSPILTTTQGLQILYVENITQEGGKTLEEASENIRTLLYQEKMEQRYHAWIADLKEKSYIKLID